MEYSQFLEFPLTLKLTPASDRDVSAPSHEDVKLVELRFFFYSLFFYLRISRSYDTLLHVCWEWLAHAAQSGRGA